MAIFEPPWGLRAEELFLLIFMFEGQNHMEQPIPAKRRMVNVALTLLGPAVAGFIYPFFFVVPYGPVWHAHVNGVLVGILIGLAVSFGEFYLFKTRIRRLPFLAFTSFQTVYYVVAINTAVLMVMISHNVLFHDSSLALETSTPALTKFFWR